MRVRTQLRWLRVYAALNTAVLSIMLLTGLGTPAPRPRWREIDVERINVVEPDGRVRLVISSQARSPRAMIRGHEYGSSGGTRAGLIFYNDERTENGGLTFAGGRVGGRVAASAGLTLDQYEQDQVVALQYQEEGGQRGQGLTIMERPEVREDEVIARRDALDRLPAGPARDSARAAFARTYGARPYGAQRLVLGRNPSGDAVINLKDRRGATRLRLVVDSLGAASIRFFDDSGRVTFSLPEPVSPKPSQVPR